MAYSVSNEYKEILYSGETDNNLYFSYGDTIVEDASPYTSSLKWTRKILNNGSNYFSLDNFVSQTIDLELHDFEITDLTKEFYFKLGTNVNGNYEYVPIGYYKIKDNPTTTNGKTTYKLYDRSINFDFNYDGSEVVNSNNGSATYLQIVQDICSKAGVELATTDFAIKNDITGFYDNTITARVHISYIAEKSGCIATIGRDGKLYFIDILKENNNAIEIPENILNRNLTTEDKYKISKVVYDSGTLLYESGDDTADKLFVNSSNLYLYTQEDIDRIYNKIKDFEIYSIDTNSIIGNPSIDPWDFIKITLTDDEGNVTKEIISLGQYDFTFNGVMKQSFLTKIDRLAKINNKSATGSLARIRALKQEINNVEASLKITAQDVYDNKQNITQLELTTEKLETSVSKTTEVVGDLESSINYFSVELAQNGLTIPTGNTNIPLTTKTYEIPYYGYFKGKQVIPNVSISGSNVGITASSSTTALKFAVKNDTPITNISNSYTITFSYFYGGANYTTSKNVTIALAPKGSDGTSVNILGSYESYEELKQAHPTGNIGDAYIVQGDMYVWNEEEQDWVDVGDIQGPAGSPGKDGTNGKSAYQIWLDNGNVGTEEDYLNSLKGEDGYTPIKNVDYFDGDDGKSAYQLWLDAGNTGSIEDYQASLKGEKGDKGNDATTYYTWLKYADTPTSGMSDNPTNKKYMGIAYNKTTPNESNNYNDYAWSLIKGEDGQDGITPIKGVDYFDGYTPVKGKDYFDGQPGDDGVSIVSVTNLYAKNTSATTAPTSGWNTTRPTRNKNEFLWVKELIKFSNNSEQETTPFVVTGDTGDKGDDGYTPVKGKDYFDGEDGTSYYTHIRYSSNANGSDMTSDPSGKSYIGVYSGTSKDAPSSYTQYTWSKFKGDNGEDGTDGNGIDKISYYYAVTKNQTAPSASNITSSTIPTLTPENKYLWQKEVIEFTDSKVADKTTILLLAVYGDKGQDGYTPQKGVDYFDGYTPIKGVDYFDGQPGTSTYFYVRYSANSNGSGMTTAPTSTTKYMGTASTTSPTAPTTTSAYTWVEIKGTDGSPGTPGSNGLTSYLHIKYSEDGINFTPADDEYALGEKPSAWIGQYVDYTEADSENFEDYTWYKFTEDIDDTLSGMQEDISNNKTNIENTKQDLLEEIDKKANSETVTTIINDVKTLQTSNSQTIQILEEIQTNGVTQVRTENNYTFNKDGLIIEETGAKTKGIFDNKGVDIIDTQGNGNDLLYAGYVDEEKADSNEKLKQFEGQSVVYSDNQYVGNYFMIGTHSRLEDYEDGTGVFYLGG